MISVSRSVGAREQLESDAYLGFTVMLVVQPPSGGRKAAHQACQADHLPERGADLPVYRRMTMKPKLIRYKMILAFAHWNEFLRQYRTNEVVDVRVVFSSDPLANTEGLLAVNRGFCKVKMTEKEPHSAPPNCAVLP